MTVIGNDAERLARAIEDGFRAVETVHALMSFHKPGSDVSRLNRDAPRRPVQVDRRTWTVLRAARRVSQASEGDFDITVASRLVDWGYLPRSPGAPPTDPTASWRDVELLEGRHVRFRKPLAIDLGGIAKGFAVDQAIDAIRATGIDTASVNAGGDLRLCGEAAETLYIRRPGIPDELIDAGMICNEAVATSADADSRRLDGNRSVSPLVDPKEGRACQAWASVTVRAPTCMLADALTKVLSCAPERGLEVLAKFAAGALVVDRKGAVRTAGLGPRPALCHA